MKTLIYGFISLIVVTTTPIGGCVSSYIHEFEVREKLRSEQTAITAAYMKASGEAASDTLRMLTKQEQENPEIVKNRESIQKALLRLHMHELRGDEEQTRNVNVEIAAKYSHIVAIAAEQTKKRDAKLSEAIHSIYERLHRLSDIACVYQTPAEGDEIADIWNRWEEKKAQFDELYIGLYGLLSRAWLANWEWESKAG